MKLDVQDQGGGKLLDEAGQGSEESWKFDNFRGRHICIAPNVQMCANMSRTSVYFAISKLTLSFSYSFHLTCTILSKVHFYTVYSMFLFLFNQSQLKAGVANQISQLCFCRKSTIGQLNVQTATAENKKIYTLRKIINIKF